MLVLTRRHGESISIGENIEVVVVRTKSNQVRLGIKAPEGTQVLRKDKDSNIEYPDYSKVIERMKHDGDIPEHT